MGNNIKKLIVRLSRSQNGVSFDDLAKILVYIGYELSKHREKGSHRIFQKQGCDHVNIPFAKPIKEPKEKRCAVLLKIRSTI